MLLEGTMEYLAAILGLGALCGCALGAYVLFEGIEREQEEDRVHVAERALPSCRCDALATRASPRIRPWTVEGGSRVPASTVRHSLRVRARRRDAPRPTVNPYRGDLA